MKAFFKALRNCLALILFFTTTSALAQKSKEAKKWLPVFKQVSLGVDTNLFLQDSAFKLGVDIVQAELAAKAPLDSLFIADFSLQLGKMMQHSYVHDKTAGIYLMLAGGYYRNLGLLEKSGDAISRYLYSYNVAAKYHKRSSTIEASDSFFFNHGNADTTLWLTVRADTVAWNKTRDTVFVTIVGGNAQGVKVNTNFDVFTTFDTFVNIKRVTVQAGRGKITRVTDYYSYGYIPLNEGFDDTIYTSDAFEVKADVDSRWVGTALSDVALYNVQFKSHDGYAYFSQGPGNVTFNSGKFEIPLKLAMIQELKESVDYYNSVDSTIMQTVVKSGPFSGYTYQKAFGNVTMFDLEMFLDFVRSYPGKYINNTYNLIERYATWVVNDCPTGHAENQIIERILDLPEEELWARQNEYAGYYMQIEKRDSLLLSIISARNGDNSKGLLADYERMQKLSMRTGLLSTDSICRINISWQYHVLKDDKKAVEWADKAWSVIPPQNRLLISIYKAIYYSVMDRNEAAIAMCDSALAIDSANYYARGYKGWNLIKSGKIKLAFPLCKYAFEIDSFVQWTSINYAHALWLKGNRDEANRLYKKSFESMSNSGDFYTGLIADFNYFIENGIQENDFKQLKTDYIQYYIEKYKYKLNGDSIKSVAVKLKDNEKYFQAAELYKKAAAQYALCTPVDWEKMRLMTRWTAYCYYKNADYKLALGQYKKAAQTTIDHGLGDDNLITDYTDISHLYDWLDDTLREMEFESRAASMEVSLREKRDAKNLYLLTVGSPFSKHNDSFSVSDANALSERISAGGALHFDQIISKNITGKNATVSALKEALDSAIYTLQQNDVFVFYYSGWGKLKNEEFITLADGDFALKDLAGYLAQVPAGRQIHIADCNGLNWRKWYQNDNFGLLANEKSSLVFLGLKNARIEESSMQHSVLTNALVEAWDKEILEGTISASEWVASASSHLMEHDRMYAIEFQTFGHDFIIGKAKIKTTIKDTVAPVIELYGAAVTRGGSNIAVVSNKNVSTGAITDESRIVYARANGLKLTISANGRFELPKELLGAKNIIIEAQDEYGNVAHREFQVSIAENNVSIGGVKYAYLFASQDYQFWSDLVNPLDDANAIGDILKENYGYSVTVIPNPDKRTITEKLDYIRRFKYGPNDQLLVFFAGHGYYDSVWGGFYVCPESLQADKDPYFETYYPQQKIADLLDGSACKNVFLVMDVCFGGKMFDKQEKHEYVSVNDGYNLSPDEFVKRQLQISCRQFLTSGGNNYVADGVAGNHSPFASRFLAALEDGATKKDYITASEIMDYLRTMRTVSNDKKSFPRYGFFGGDKDGEYVMKVTKKIGSSAIIARQ